MNRTWGITVKYTNGKVVLYWFRPVRIVLYGLIIAAICAVLLKTT